MDTTPVIVTRTFDVGVEEIWSALSDNEKLKQWFFVLPEFKAESGFEFTFTGGPEEGPEYVHLCKVVEAIPNEKISYTWRYDGFPGNSLVSIELFPQNDGTKVVLTHTGLETIEPAGPDFSKSNFLEGWTYFIHTALNDFLSAKN